MEIPANWACFRAQSTALIVGPTGAGKSHLMAQIITHRDQLFDKKIEEIIWHYTEEGSVMSELAERHGVQFRQGLPALDDFPVGAGLSFSSLMTPWGKWTKQL